LSSVIYRTLDGDTFEFWLDYDNAFGKPITKIEILNGGHNNALLLHTEMVNLQHGEKSGTFAVSGFTQKSGDGDKKYIFGVRLTFNDETTQFASSSAVIKSKIRILFGGLDTILFYPSL